MLIDELRAVSDKNSNEMYSVLKQMCFDEANKGNYELERYFDLSGNVGVEAIINFNLDLKETKKDLKAKALILNTDIWMILIKNFLLCQKKLIKLELILIGNIRR
jgi:hypothetical protein